MFGVHNFSHSMPPSWQCNPFNSKCASNGDVHWSSIPDFGNAFGDVKTIWEASRFGWLVHWAWAVRSGGDVASLRLPINEWMASWCRENGVHRGVNWKCGQESSLRALHTLLAFHLLEEDHRKSPACLREFLAVHLERIEPSLSYALGQDNNHGTSEAAALFCVGAFLADHGDTQQAVIGRRCERKGRRWLVNRASRLIMPDGTFSQYSVVYHRMMLDTLSFAECWRRALSRKPFKATFYRQGKLATHWLSAMVDPVSGDAPNIGANDGSHLFNVGATPYRDFRPSLSWAQAVFLGSQPTGTVQHELAEVFSLKVSSSTDGEHTSSSLFAEGGFARLAADSGFGILRLPQYKFRPSHADALHLDIWHRGRNIIRDGGTYSYNTSDELTYHFPSTACHSTVELEGREQMPRLSRFLFGSWLRSRPVVTRFDDTSVESVYTDYRGASHKRLVEVTDTGWRITDDVAVSDKGATARWRLLPVDWRLDGNTAISSLSTIRVTITPASTVTLEAGVESRHYLEKNAVPVLCIRMPSSGRLITELVLN